METVPVGQWQYKKFAPDFWESMDDDMNKLLEELYAEYKKRGAEEFGLPVVAFNRGEYEFDFGHMRQTNMKSGRQRMIRRLRPDEESANPASPSRRRAKSASISLSPAASQHCEELRPTFEAFCGQQNGMDNKTFAKLCRDCNLVENRFKDQDIDVIFAKVVPQGQRRISLQHFELAIREIAWRRGEEMAAVCTLVAECPGPALRATSTDAVRFYDRARLGSAASSGVCSPRSSFDAQSSIISSISTTMTTRSSTRTRCHSPGPGMYDPKLPGPRITGGSMEKAERRLDFKHGGRDCSPDPKWVVPKQERVRGGGYFGTGHVTTVHTGGPGPGSYTPQKVGRHVSGTSLGKRTGHDLDFSNGI